MTPAEKRILTLTAAAHGLVHLYEGVLPPLIPLLVADYGTDYFHLGIVVSVFSYAFGLGSLPTGYLADTVGPRRLVTIYLFGSGISAMLVGGVGSLASYGFVMGLMGLFCSTYHPASNTLIALAVKERGRAFGIHGIAGSLGVAMVPVVSASLGSLLGWRAPHVLFGLMGVVAGCLSLTVSSARPTALETTSAGEREGARARTPLLHLSIFYLSAMALGLTYKGIMTFLPTYLGERVELSFLTLDTVALGGAVATLALLSGAVGQYLAGRLADYYKPERLYFISIAMGTVFVFVMASASNLLLVAAAVIYALFYFAAQPIQNYLLSSYVPRQRQGLGFGIHFFLSFGVGSTAAALAGWLADRFGLEAVFQFTGMCFLVASGLALFLMLKAPDRTY
jgi:MFS family permease